MEFVRVEIEVPKPLLDILGGDNNEVVKKLRIAIAVELYREGVVSLGFASKIAGVSIDEMMKILKEKKVELNYDEEELKKDLELVERLVMSRKLVDEIASCTSMYCVVQVLRRYISSNPDDELSRVIGRLVEMLRGMDLDPAHRWMAVNAVCVLISDLIASR